MLESGVNFFDISYLKNSSQQLNTNPKYMTFGPYKLRKAYVEGAALILDLEDKSGEIICKPRRLMSYFGHEMIFKKARLLEGCLVITTTLDPLKNPPKFWWIDVDEYIDPSFQQTRNTISNTPRHAISRRFIQHQPTRFPEQNTTPKPASNEKISELLNKFKR
jgi:hypothetical protein